MSINNRHQGACYHQENNQDQPKASKLDPFKEDYYASTTLKLKKRFVSSKIP